MMVIAEGTSICTLTFVSGSIFLCLEGTWKALCHVTETPSMNLNMISEVLGGGVGGSLFPCLGVSRLGCNGSAADGVGVSELI